MRPPSLLRPTFAAAVLCLAFTPACGFLKSIVGVNTVDLKEADIKTMGVDLRRPQKTICPREPVQMAVFIEAKLKGEDQPKKYETWVGKGFVRKNDKLSFDDFAFHSDLGTFDPQGWFTPATDLTASIDKEFELLTVLKARPDKFSIPTKYKPDYDCITSGGGAGNA